VSGVSSATTIIVGPVGHGANRHAAAIAAATGSAIRAVEQPGELDIEHASGAPVVHLHYTDRLWGDDATSAGNAFRDATAQLRRPVVVTLHDLPDDDGTERERRRAAAYGLVARLAAASIVASSHERRRLQRCGADAEIIALPIRPGRRRPQPPRPPAPLATEPTVVVIGFLYPGKGHDDVVDAAAALEQRVRVVCAGAASPSHEDLPHALRTQAGRLTVDVTGPLSDEDLEAVAGAAAVPVVPARNPSASSSLATWIGLGRRPLAAENEFTRELADLRPELLNLYDARRPGALADAITAALADPASTRRSVPIPPTLRTEHVAARHLAAYARAARCHQS
jgi:glycosyltransferase involved in cell wall biosynthesis